MKNVYFGINLCFGAVCGLLGLASLLCAATAAYDFTYGIVGVLALVIAAMCLWLACDCRPQGRNQHA
jgi:uncharacterized membrane protein YedE/YeeE